MGETPGRAVEKEVRQEAGLEVSAARVLAVFDRDFGDGRSGRRTSTSCTSGASCWAASRAGDGLETEEAAFFAVDELPELSPKTPSEHLGRVLAHTADPGWGAELD